MVAGTAVGEEAEAVAAGGTVLALAPAAAAEGIAGAVVDLNT